MKSLIFILSIASLLAVAGAESNQKVVRLVGYVDVSGDKRALLAMPVESPGLRPYQDLRERWNVGQLELKKIDSVQEEVEVQSEANPLHIAFAGEPDAESLAGCLIRLEKCPLQQVIEIYPRLTGRSANGHEYWRQVQRMRHGHPGAFGLRAESIRLQNLVGYCFGRISIDSLIESVLGAVSSL